MKHVNFTGSLLLVTLIVSGMTAFPTSAAEKLYRWTDESGNQVNSDRPPSAEVDYEVISTQSSMVRALDEEETSPSQAEDSDEQPYEAAQEEGEEPDNRDTKINAEYCEIAKNNLTQLNSTARIRLKSDNGEMRYLNEEEKEIQRKNATRAIATYCP